MSIYDNVCLYMAMYVYIYGNVCLYMVSDCGSTMYKIHIGYSVVFVSSEISVICLLIISLVVLVFVSDLSLPVDHLSIDSLIV